MIVYLRATDFHLQNGMTAAYLAAQEGNVEIIRILAEGGANLQLSNTQGVSPCLVATQFGSGGMGHGGHLEVVQFLAGAGLGLRLS